MKGKWIPHIIAAVVLVIFIGLLMACASTPKGIEERKAGWLNPKNNRWYIDRAAVDKNVPLVQHAILYCDPGYGVKEKVLTRYRVGAVLIPLDIQRLYAIFDGDGNKSEVEITFALQRRSAFAFLTGTDNLEAPTLEAGKS